jgi:hypothetical protein
MDRPLIIAALAAASTLAATAALSQTAAPLFDANAAAALQDLLTKADAQNIRVVPQPQGLVVNGRMLGYSGPGENIVGMSADQILEWSRRDLGGGKRYCSGKSRPKAHHTHGSPGRDNDLRLASCAHPCPLYLMPLRPAARESGQSVMTSAQNTLYFDPGA